MSDVNDSESQINNLNEFKTKYIELLNLLIDQKIKIENKDKIINFSKNISDEDIQILSDRFVKSVEKTGKVKKMFLNRNPRVFSNKYAVKLIPSINLKSVLTSLDNNTFETNSASVLVNDGQLKVFKFFLCFFRS